MKRAVSLLSGLCRGLGLLSAHPEGTWITMVCLKEDGVNMDVIMVVFVRGEAEEERDVWPAIFDFFIGCFKKGLHRNSLLLVSL